MAIPDHGSDRTGHVLRRRRWRATHLGLVAVLGPFGCGVDAPTPSSGAEASSARLAGLLQPLFRTVDAPFESLGWYAVLRERSGTVHALRERFDRLSTDPVPRSGALPASEQSEGSHWRFDALVRVDGAMASSEGTSDVWQQLQRAAVGLAQARATALSSNATSGARFGVLGHRVSRHPIDALDDDCAGRWRIDLDMAGTLVTSQTRCPVGETSGSLVRSVSDGQPAVLVWSADGERRTASGIAWQRRVRGVPPSPGAAVVFDTAVLTLAGVGTLELTRSRRTSGRGVPVVTGTLSHRGERSTLRDPVWSTVPRSATGTNAGSGSRIAVASLGVDVALDALAVPVTANDDLFAAALVSQAAGWSGALFASGSHSGAGFAEYGPGGS